MGYLDNLNNEFSNKYEKKNLKIKKLYRYVILLFFYLDKSDQNHRFTKKSYKVFGENKILKSGNL
jgi:hypothetical protein